MSRAVTGVVTADTRHSRTQDGVHAELLGAMGASVSSWASTATGPTGDCIASGMPSWRRRHLGRYWPSVATVEKTINVPRLTMAHGCSAHACCPLAGLAVFRRAREANPWPVRHLPGTVRSTFLSFAERGLAQAFLGEANRLGYESKALVHNAPHFFACVREVADELRRLQADLLCCSGYKPDLVGWWAARRLGIPVVSIAHGWTGDVESTTE